MPESRDHHIDALYQKRAVEAARASLDDRHAMARQYARQRQELTSSQTAPTATAPPVNSADGSIGVGAIAESVAGVGSKISGLTGINALLIQYAVPILAVILIGGGIGLGIASIVNNIAVNNQIEAYNESTGDGAASGAFVPSTDPRHPVKVTIPSLLLDIDTTQVGINKSGHIGSPSNIKRAAWYTGSSSPADEDGLAVITAHAGSERYPGAFATLYEIKEGDEIDVTMGDGESVRYAVTTIEDINAESIDMAEYLSEPSKQLLLITCSGDYNARTYSYEDRLFVTAEPI